ncbi:hypothetical protein VIGAN_10071500 [Vigna angularis var. angularis]|uniref:Uncharacterized protein n=1 Tax=Vigna angularis var. angularis TaxID=157739 RepID=A0A0S3T2K4_PHAAN|nr:hypothetical protein VIGAN_10071500 [Vigna angularis var. angularis]
MSQTLSPNTPGNTHPNSTPSGTGLPENHKPYAGCSRPLKPCHLVPAQRTSDTSSEYSPAPVTETSETGQPNRVYTKPDAKPGWPRSPTRRYHSLHRSR